MKNIKRRDFIKTSAAAAAGITAAPYILRAAPMPGTLMTRRFGKFDFEVTTFALGGQASLQWTPAEEKPVDIILKAFDAGVNYFDTSNLYGPSQTNFGKAFDKLDLIPGKAGYNESKRRAMWLTTKTHLRLAKSQKEWENVGNWTNGPKGSHTVDDLKRSLSQMFGDGQGNYPKGAYVDMVLLHSISKPEEIDAVYAGLDNPSPNLEEIGALAALRDYRDGTNFTGLNPKEEKLLRHIGFSGHFSPALMMEMIQRDKHNVLEGMLIAINANDPLKFNMQYNAIPVAQAKNMGVIGMKVFADGAMYSKGSHWSNKPEHVVRTVSSPEMPSDKLVHYTLTTPGVHTAIMGIGHVDDDPRKCQLHQNILASQIKPDGLTDSRRREIEEMAHQVKNGDTNYFQTDAQPLSAPQSPAIKRNRDGSEMVTLQWHTAFASDAPLVRYDILKDGKKIGDEPYRPQTSKTPFEFNVKADGNRHAYQIVTVDAKGCTASTEKLQSS